MIDDNKDRMYHVEYRRNNLIKALVMPGAMLVKVPVVAVKGIFKLIVLMANCPVDAMRRGREIHETMERIKPKRLK